jgi:hypothetical protein
MTQVSAALLPRTGSRCGLMARYGRFGTPKPGCLTGDSHRLPRGAPEVAGRPQTQST